MAADTPSIGELKLIEYLNFKLTDNNVQKMTTSNNTRLYRENTRCLINVNQQKIRTKNDEK